MHYKSLIAALAIATLTFSQAAFAVQNDQQLVDALENTEWTNSVTTSSAWEYQSFQSCEDFETVINDFIQDNKQLRDRPYPVMYMEDDMMMADMDGAEIEQSAPQTVSSRATRGSDEKSFSTTNLQVWGVDEPEILKTDGDHLYYYSQQLKKIFILEHGNGLAWGDLEDALGSISVPDSLNNIQLFLQDNTLTVLGNRWSEASGRWLLDNGQKTVASVFDVSDPSAPQLDAFHDLDGYMTDARMIDGELTIITSLGVNRWRWYEADQNGEDVDLMTLLPTQRSVVYTKDGELDIKGTKYPYTLTNTQADCNNIQYLFPDADTLKQMQAFPNFTNVYSIDTASSDTPELTTLFGNTQQIHMSLDNLYLTSSHYLPSGSSCPINARCLFPSFGSQQTLIHKYELDGMEYDGSALIDGAPLPQWSMSESSDEEFRILTRQRSPQAATHLTILDNDLDLEGSLKNIEPGEEFKASRYIWDKLYLVTFEQIDPLFVIDLADSKDPEILWELKIPGYSTYLHPYAPQDDDIQYLIGLGYDTTTSQRGWVTTAWVKIDLYTIDYSEAPIKIEQTHTLTMGEQGSWTEVADNPRQFVWNAETNTLLIPVLLQETVKWSNCQVFYDTNGNEESRECYETQRQVPQFAWLKQVQIDLKEWIEEATLIDLKPIMEQFEQYGEYEYGYEENEWLNQWQIRNLMMRAGFIEDEAYLFTNHSVTFTDGETEETVILK